MKIAYIICWCITNLAFIAMSVFLSVWFGNLNFLWFLTVPILSFFGLEISDRKSDKGPTENTSDPFDFEE